jgi:translocation and assembly module TamB
MLRALRILLGLVLVLVVALVTLVGGLLVGLNTDAGRQLAVREINKLAGANVKIAGLGGHFPADLKLQDVQVIDTDGAWLHATDVELRWRPLQLLQRNVHVEEVSAAQIDVLRLPVPSSSNSSGGGSLPAFQLTVDRLGIGTLTLAPQVATEAIALHVQGAAQFRDVAHGSLQLDATTPDGDALYHVAGIIDPENVSLNLHVSEPPGGLLGHYAGPQAQAPLTIDIALAGPRDNAALNFGMALGDAKLDGAGHLGLVPAHQFADVLFTVPELAPFGALAGSTIGGNTQLHLRVAQAEHGIATLALDGTLAVRQAPATLQKFLGPHDDLTLRASLLNDNVTINKLRLSGADFTVDLSGRASADGIDLVNDVNITQVAALSPAISGNVTASSHISGTIHDFAVQAKLGGMIGVRGQASDPFNIDVDVQHLPSTPSGTVTGNGKLENAPLILNADFAREADGAFQVDIGQVLWRSVTAKANLHLAPGAALPTGTAVFAIKSLNDFSPFVPTRLQGSVNGDFAYTQGGDLKLNLNAAQLIVVPSVGAINGKITASGPVQALGVKTQLTTASLMGKPAQLDFAGVLDVQKRSAQLASLNGSWHGLNARLQGPAAIETQPAIAVRHLKLAVNGGTLAVDGVVSPQLNAKASVQNLPLSIANLFAPTLNATGIINADAALRGTPAAPSGTVTLRATGLHVNQGAAEALPLADIAGSAQLAAKSANLDVKLNAGPQIALELSGLAPFQTSGQMNLRALGRVDLQLLNLLLSAGGTAVRGEMKTNLQLTGTPQNPNAAGSVTLRDGSVENIGTGLNLTQISADVTAQGRNVVLQTLTATAGQGTLTGKGTLGLDGELPIALTLNADNASLVTSDLITETLNGAVTLNGAIRGPMTLGGNIEIAKANINIPRGLPPSVANLPIINEGEKPPPPPAPPPPIALNLDVRARNQIFVRGDGLFAELGGHVHLGGTLAALDPEGRFDLIRGNFALAGKNLQFTSGSIGFAGNGFVPVLDLVASVSSSTVSDATLTVGGTAAKPVITLSSTPPLPSDEVLAQLLFGQSASSLTPFQAASLAVALAQISGIGGGAGSLDKVRSALGLDELSVGGTGSGPISLQAGRYVAPGVYVGATQAANGQGTRVNVQVNLYKGLQLQTATGTSSTGEDSSSVGLSYQFNY